MPKLHRVLALFAGTTGLIQQHRRHHAEVMHDGRPRRHERPSTTTASG